MKEYIDYQQLWDGELKALLGEALIKVRVAASRAAVYSSDRAAQVASITEELEELLIELEGITPHGLPPYHSLPSVN